MLDAVRSWWLGGPKVDTRPPLISDKMTQMIEAKNRALRLAKDIEIEVNKTRADLQMAMDSLSAANAVAHVEIKPEA